MIGTLRDFSASVEFTESDSTLENLTRQSCLCEDQQSFLIKEIHNNLMNKNKKDPVLFISDIKLTCDIPSVENTRDPKHCEKYRIHSGFSQHKSQRQTIMEKTHEKFNPFLYEINVQHGIFSWTIHRRYGDFLSIHEQLLIRLATLQIPIPTKREKAIRSSFREETRQRSVKMGRKTYTLPLFPIKLEILVQDQDIDHRKDLLETYLQTIISYKSLRGFPHITNFLEISTVSFIGSLGIKRKEGLVLKRCGGRTVSTGCFDLVNNITYRWKSRWLIVKDSFVAYLNPQKNIIGDVMLVDNEFSVKYRYLETGHRHGMIVINKNRRLNCDCIDSDQITEWEVAIGTMLDTTAKDFHQINKHGSFAPLRPESYCKWYIDGETYMTAVGKAIEKAKEEIYIADWWLSPQLHLKRPAIDNYWRIDEMLLRKAKQGVYVFILLFKELEITMNINSFYTKRILSNLHPNIQILRHPDHLKRRVFLWSHHEKLVVIDQKIALLGGIDLSYGRWDTYEHPIQDVSDLESREDSPINDAPVEKLTSTYNKDTIHVRRKSTGGFRFKSILRMDHDEATKAPSEKDNNHNNCNTYQYCQLNFRNISRNVPLLKQDKLTVSSIVQCSGWHSKRYRKTKKLYSNCQQNCNFSSISNGRGCLNSHNFTGAHITESKTPTNSLFMGKDYVNWIIKDCDNLEEPDIDLVDRDLVPRMPWHDISCLVYGRSARDVARHFIQRWNVVKKEKVKNSDKYCMLVPKSYSHSEIQKQQIVNCDSATCQVLRSVSKWSININSTENSILNAYIETISKAEHFVYIENQFFISSTNQETDVIKNEISKAILERIIHFHKKSQLFRVFLILPLLPAFEAESENCTSTALYTVLHYVYRSLFRGPTSLFENLLKLGIDPDQYISIVGLRNYGNVGPNLLTEQIYVHSKLLIVDDRYSIIGSSNLNDRSMIGFRDSEIAIYFEDEKLKKSKLGDCEVEVGNFSSSLRKALMSEHLGVNLFIGKLYFDIQLLENPVQDKFFHEVWCDIAKKNAVIFSDVFDCIPADHINNLSTFHKLKFNKSLAHTDPDLARKMIKKVKGHLVVFPSKFLEEENLEPALTTKEGIIPVETWL